MHKLGSQELEEICSYLSFSDIHRLHATGNDIFRKRFQLQPFIRTVEEHEKVYEWITNSDGKRITTLDISRYTDNMRSVKMICASNCLTTLRVHELNDEILSIIPHTVTDLTTTTMLNSIWELPHSITRFTAK